ncbi:hypothetical protein [Rhodoferax sp.]|uniref:hypothetical protein n=1 Tax=Rhodoferax sp. TaxID=50421 RepID=UPI00374CFA56
MCDADQKDSTESPGRPRIISFKHLGTMYACIDRLHRDTFDEYHIRSLLLGVRAWVIKESEPFRHKEKLSDIERGLLLIREIANYIAHPEILDRGVIRQIPLAKDRQFVRLLEKRNHPKNPNPTFEYLNVDPDRKMIWLKEPPEAKGLLILEVVNAFFIAIAAVFGRVIFEVVMKYVENVVLCFYSILHGANFEWECGLEKNGEDGMGGGFLAIDSIDGFYKLFAGLKNSKTSQYFESRSGMPSYEWRYFRVFNERIRMHGGRKMDIKNPSPVYALRDPEGILRLVDLSWI